VITYSLTTLGCEHLLWSRDFLHLAHCFAVQKTMPVARHTIGEQWPPLYGSYIYGIIPHFLVAISNQIDTTTIAAFLHRHLYFIDRLISLSSFAGGWGEVTSRRNGKYSLMGQNALAHETKLFIITSHLIGNFPRSKNVMPPPPYLSIVLLLQKQSVYSPWKLLGHHSPNWPIMTFRFELPHLSCKLRLCFVSMQ